MVHLERRREMLMGKLSGLKEKYFIILILTYVI